jgi:uncharacterized surface protein with fasciclin (FAS1) repeats
MLDCCKTHERVLGVGGLGCTSRSCHMLHLGLRFLAVVLAVGLAVPAFAAEKEQDIVDTAVAAGKFKTLVAAVKAAELVDTLKGPGPFTVFAPTDEAFAKLGDDSIQSLLKDKAKLGAILKYHVIPGAVMSKEAAKVNGPVKTVQGKELMIQAKGGEVMIGKAKVITTDIKCKNGVIHVIDAVLLPPTE